jgi:hypothetical protein
VARIPGASDSPRVSPVDRLLPAAGRKGRAPKWPSGLVPDDAEAAAWSRLWRLPQAVAWASLPGAAEQVERYARLTVAVGRDFDAGEVKAAALAQMRGLESDLGIGPTGMAKLRWHIGDAPAPRSASVTPLQAVPRPRRMRAAGGG